jgi:hypothetical protein
VGIRLSSDGERNEALIGVGLRDNRVMERGTNCDQPLVSDDAVLATVPIVIDLSTYVTCNEDLNDYLAQ